MNDGEQERNPCRFSLVLESLAGRNQQSLDNPRLLCFVNLQETPYAKTIFPLEDRRNMLSSTYTHTYQWNEPVVLIFIHSISSILQPYVNIP